MDDNISWDNLPLAPAVCRALLYPWVDYYMQIIRRSLNLAAQQLCPLIVCFMLLSIDSLSFGGDEVTLNHNIV